MEIWLPIQGDEINRIICAHSHLNCENRATSNSPLGQAEQLEIDLLRGVI